MKTTLGKEVLKISMSQTEEDSKESSVKKMILEDISKNEIKKPSELEVMKTTEKDRSGIYKALSKLVDDGILCRYKKTRTKSYYWLLESDVDEIEEKLPKKVPGLKRGEISTNKVEPKGWFESKKGAKKREEKLLKMLNTRVESLTKKEPTEEDIEDLLPGNVRVLEIRDFIEEKEILHLAHKSELLMELLENSYKDFRDTGEMDMHGKPFLGCLLYFQIWDHALDDEDSDLVGDEKRVKTLLEILERRLSQLGLKYWESVRMGEGEFWDEESDPPHKEIEIIQSIIEKLEDEERAQEDKLKDLKARLNEIL